MGGGEEWHEAGWRGGGRAPAEHRAAGCSIHLTVSLQRIRTFFPEKHLLTYKFLFQSRKMRGKIFLDFVYETKVSACMQEKRRQPRRRFGDAEEGSSIFTTRCVILAFSELPFLPPHSGEDRSTHPTDLLWRRWHAGGNASQMLGKMSAMWSRLQKGEKQHQMIAGAGYL